MQVNTRCSIIGVELGSSPLKTQPSKRYKEKKLKKYAQRGAKIMPRRGKIAQAEIILSPDQFQFYALVVYSIFHNFHVMLWHVCIPSLTPSQGHVTFAGHTCRNVPLHHALWICTCCRKQQLLLEIRDIYSGHIFLSKLKNWEEFEGRHHAKKVRKRGGKKKKEKSDKTHVKIHL